MIPKLWVKIIDLDLARRRISLSIKQAAEGGELAAEYREHFEVDRNTVNKLRSRRIRCGNVNPRAAQQLTTMLAYKLDRDPWFTSVAQPL